MPAINMGEVATETRLALASAVDDEADGEASEEMLEYVLDAMMAAFAEATGQVGAAVV